MTRKIEADTFLGKEMQTREEHIESFTEMMLEHHATYNPDLCDFDNPKEVDKLKNHIIKCAKRNFDKYSVEVDDG